MFGRL